MSSSARRRGRGKFGATPRWAAHAATTEALAFEINAALEKGNR